MYVLDTDHVSILEKRGSSPEYRCLSARIGDHDPSLFFVSIVSFHERALGWNAYIKKAKTPETVAKGYARLAQVLKDFSAAQLLDFDVDAAQLFADLRHRRIRISTMDLRIAASAVKGFTVLTRNFSDFEKVPGLKFDDWTRMTEETES